MCDDFEDVKHSAIYVHWPYCLSKCPYCDFNSHVLKGKLDEGKFVDALGRELLFQHNLWGERKIKSIFFGGGTPSLMHPKMVARMLRYIKREYEILPDSEITMEVNPNSAEARKFSGYRKAGVNRLSIGVQSFDKKGLKFLGRTHDVKAARRAIETAKEHFDNVSIDLIYARPGQTLESWKLELEQALEFDLPHMSLYELTIEPDTKFETLVKHGKMSVMSPDKAADFYLFTQEFMEKAGMPAYEVSNHAKPGFECRHNMNYWTGGEYISVGPGAHTRIDCEVLHTKVASANVKDPDIWYSLVQEEGLPVCDMDVLTWPEQANEMVAMASRLRRGIDLEAYAFFRKKPMSRAAITKLYREGLVKKPRSTASGYLEITSKGLLFSDYIARTILAADTEPPPPDASDTKNNTPTAKEASTSTESSVS